MAQRYGPRIVTDELKLCLDPAELKPSYTKVGSTDIVTEFYNLQANNANNEETLEIGNDPWGRRAVLDRSLNNDTTSNYDGGDTSGTYNIDSSVKHRFTYFFRVDKKGSNGTLYFGLHGYNSSGSNIGVHYNNGTSSTTNPYFSYPAHQSSAFEEGRWYMFVAYVHPVGSTNPTDSTAGFYDMQTGLQISSPSSGNVGPNAVWVSGTTKTLFRYYLYYSTDPTVEMSWYEARIDPVDGNEPSITDMINQCPDRLVNLTNNGYNARIRNGVTYNSGEKSFSLTGSNQSHLIVPSHSDLDITGDMTLESWVYIDSSMNTGLGFLMCKRDASDYTSPFQFSFGDRSGSETNTFRVVMGGGGTTYSVVGDNNNFNGVYNKWDHVVFTISGTSMKIYVNGANGGTATFSGTRQTNTIPLRFGGVYNWYTTDYMLTGRMAGMKIYSKALTESEVLSNYNNQKARFI